MKSYLLLLNATVFQYILDIFKLNYFIDIIVFWFFKFRKTITDHKIEIVNEDQIRLISRKLDFSSWGFLFDDVFESTNWIE